MAPRRILIHAGVPKTATTTIQSALLAGRDALRSAGVCYPGGHRVDQVKLRTAFLDDPLSHVVNRLTGGDADALRAEGRLLLARLATELREPGIDTGLLSNEGLSQIEPSELGRLRDWAAGLAPLVEGLVWVREPVAHTVSTVQQVLKAGQTLPSLAASPPVPRYRTRVGRLAETFGRDRLRLSAFERQVRHPEGVVGAFLDDIGLEDAAARAAVIEGARDENASLSQEAALILDAMNRLRPPLRADGRPDPGRSIGRELRLLRQVRGGRFRLPGDLLARIHEQTRDDARWLAGEWGIDDYLDSPLPEAAGPPPAWPDGWTAESLAAALLDLLQGTGDAGRIAAAAAALGLPEEEAGWRRERRRRSAADAIFDLEDDRMTDDTRSPPSDEERRLRLLLARALWISGLDAPPPRGERPAAFAAVKAEQMRRAARLLRALERGGVTLSAHAEAPAPAHGEPD